MLGGPHVLASIRHAVRRYLRAGEAIRFRPPQRAGTRRGAARVETEGESALGSTRGTTVVATPEGRSSFFSVPWRLIGETVRVEVDR